MKNITLPWWAHVLVAVGVFYVASALDLQNKLPMPKTGA